MLCGCSLFDKTPPEIESLSLIVEYGTDLGISEIVDVTDNYRVQEIAIQNVVGGRGSISENGDSVNSEVPGEYSVIIVTSDQKGNTAEAECPISVIDKIVL